MLQPCRMHNVYMRLEFVIASTDQSNLVSKPHFSLFLVLDHDTYLFLKLHF